jgi:hypothetical protein
MKAEEERLTVGSGLLRQRVRLPRREENGMFSVRNRTQEIFVSEVCRLIHTDDTMSGSYPSNLLGMHCRHPKRVGLITRGSVSWHRMNVQVPACEVEQLGCQ